MNSFYIDTVCSDVSAFSSGYNVFDKYLQSGGHPAVIHYVFESESDRLIAYFSLLASAMLIGDPSKLNVASAIEVEMFAIDEKFRGTGLSIELLDAVVKTIKNYKEEYVGADIAILYSVPVEYVISLYEKMGFRRATGGLTAFKSDFTNGCVPMYMAI